MLYISNIKQKALNSCVENHQHYVLFWPTVDVIIYVTGGLLIHDKCGTVVNYSDRL